MKINYSLPSSSIPSKQTGMVLIVGLVMVLLLTIIGVAAIRGSGLQESMAANMRDTNVAFQAAETGLRVCENSILNDSASGAFTCAYENGDLNTTASNSVINSDTWLSKAAALSTAIPNVSSQPQALIEKLYTDPTSYGALHGGAIGGPSKIPIPITYRVTVQSTGAADTTQVVLQTTYNY